ncbi:MAG: PP2C family protein-serine/threonine phosphatase [Microcystaceae cyanobacterium]
MRPNIETIPFSATPSATPHSAEETTPILALKELVATLHREQNKVQNLLSSLGFALRSFNNLNQFLELTPLMAARVTDADGSALILFKSPDSITLEQLHCQDSQITQKTQSTLEELVRQFNHETADTSSLGTLDGEIRQALGREFRLYSTPILIKNEERGRLYVFSKDGQYIWTQTRRRLLQLVADQTAVAIANSELTVELRSKERQDRELEIASEIQERLLPRKCPTIQGVELAARCQTASRVGGDYYDFIPSNYDKFSGDQNDVDALWSIVIGDVMGKGVPAGLIMTMTRGMLRAEVLNRHSPAQVLRHLNRVMYSDLESSRRFVTLFYSEYDPKRRILSFSNAAHNPPLLWQAKSRSISRLDTMGMLIGLEIDSDYEDDTFQLEIGDTILYYTDGLTDAVSPRGTRFDEDNLIYAFKCACQQGFTPQEVLDYLFDQVETFVGQGNGNSDDMTMVVMQLTP